MADTSSLFLDPSAQILARIRELIFEDVQSAVYLLVQAYEDGSIEKPSRATPSSTSEELWTIARDRIRADLQAALDELLGNEEFETRDYGSHPSDEEEEGVEWDEEGAE